MNELYALILFALFGVGSAFVLCILYSYYITDIKYYKYSLKEEIVKRSKIDAIIRNIRNELINKETQLKSLDESICFLYEIDYIKLKSKLEIIQEIEEAIKYEV